MLQTSYINFYLCNDGLVMPAFDDAHDMRARATLADCFPGRDISQVPALDIVAAIVAWTIIRKPRPAHLRACASCICGRQRAQR